MTAPPPSNETRWILRAQAGDTEAYASLMGEHLRAIQSFLCHRVPAPHLIDELTHETFVLAHHKLSSFTPGTRFRAWLCAIAWQLVRREVLRFSRDQTNRDRLTRYLENLCQDPATVPRDLDERMDHLETCLLKLSESDRQLIRLKYESGDSSREISERLEQSEEWVRTRLYRTRNRLRHCILQKSQHPPTPPIS